MILTGVFVVYTGFGSLTGWGVTFFGTGNGKSSLLSVVDPSLNEYSCRW
jgi:hypothetical protein